MHCNINMFCISLISVLYSLYGTQFLRPTFVLLSSLATAVFLATKTYASEYPQRLDSNELIKNLIGFSYNSYRLIHYQ